MRPIIVILSLLIPLLGTTLGSAMVFFLKKEINPKVQKVLLGFASGVMKSYVFPAVGFLVGVGFMLLLDYLVPHMHINKEEEGLKKNKYSKTFKMLLAVTLHNIPEGLAVGVVIASMMTNQVNEQAVLALAIGMAIQNFPEGAIVSMPLKEEGESKGKAFLYGFISGAVEPIAALIALAVTYFVSIILPFVLAFAAGVMIYVVVEELIPEANEGKHSNLATIGLAVGFVLRMVLDIALG